MRHISQQGLDPICRFEGYSPLIYMCPAGYPTIGYGHMITELMKWVWAGGQKLKGLVKRRQAECLMYA